MPDRTGPAERGRRNASAIDGLADGRARDASSAEVSEIRPLSKMPNGHASMSTGAPISASMRRRDSRNCFSANRRKPSGVLCVRSTFLR